MIPKIIHYCWFGGKPLTNLAVKCIESWKKYCPDYEIVRWDESNYDYTANQYMLQAYENKKWAFVSDYVRLDVVYKYGGFYLDTDVELLKSLDELRIYKGYAGIEDKDLAIIALGLGFGAESKNNMVKTMLDDYDKRSFVKKTGDLDLTPSPVIQTDCLKKCGFSYIDTQINKISDDFVILSKDYLNPMDMNTGVVHITPRAISIHHYAASWVNKNDLMRGKIYRFLYRRLGKNTSNLLRKIFGRK